MMNNLFNTNVDGRVFNLRGKYQVGTLAIVERVKVRRGVYRCLMMFVSARKGNAQFYSIMKKSNEMRDFKKRKIVVDGNEFFAWVYVSSDRHLEEVAKAILELKEVNEVAVSGKKFRNSDFPELNESEDNEENETKSNKKENEEREMKNNEFESKGYTKQEVSFAESVLKEIEVFEDDYEVFGIRVDDGIKYEFGEELHISHKVMDDPVYDENWELVVERCEEGIYYGMYDLGEYEGTCAFKINTDSNNVIEEIIKTLRRAKSYHGENIHLIAGDYLSSDEYEAFGIVIGDAICLERYDKRRFYSQEKKTLAVYELVKEAEAKARGARSHAGIIGIRNKLVLDIKRIFVDESTDVRRWARSKINAIAVERGFLPSIDSFAFGYKDSKRFPSKRAFVL